jgi:hypothetical protein
LRRIIQACLQRRNSAIQIRPSRSSTAHGNACQIIRGLKASAITELANAGLEVTGGHTESTSGTGLVYGLDWEEITRPL